MLTSHDLFLLFRLVLLPDRRSHQTSQLKLKTSCVKPLKLITKHDPRRWNCYNIRGLPSKAPTKLLHSTNTWMLSRHVWIIMFAYLLQESSNVLYLHCTSVVRLDQCSNFLYLDTYISLSRQKSVFCRWFFEFICTTFSFYCRFGWRFLSRAPMFRILLIPY